LQGQSTGLAVSQAARERRLIVGIVSGFAGRGAALLAPLIVMPAMLAYLGAVQFGLWMTVVSLTGMVAFMDLGLGNGLLTRLANCHGRGDMDQAREYLSSAYGVLAGVAGLLLLSAFIADGTGLFSHWLSATAETPEPEFERLILVCIIAFGLGIPAALIQKIQYSFQKVWQASIWQAANATATVILTLLTIRAGLSPWLVVACYAMTPVAILGISTLVFFSLYRPDLVPHPAFIRRESAVDLLLLGMRFLMLSVLTSVALNLDNMIIANRLGLAAVTDYAVPAKLAALLGVLISVIFLPLWPANGEAIARREKAWVQKSTRRMSMWGGLFVGLAGLGLTVCSNWIMQAWMGRTFPDQHLVIAWMTLLSVAMAVGSPYHMVMNSAGALRVQLAGWTLYLLVSALLKYFFVVEFGAISIAAVSALCYSAIVVPAAFLGAKLVLDERST